MEKARSDHCVRATFERAGSLERGRLGALEEEVAAEIAKAVDFAEAGTWESIEELTQFVYSEERRNER